MIEGGPIKRKLTYKFQEDEVLKEIQEYIDSTYGAHYAFSDKDVQTFELISRWPERGFHFATGNMMKLSDRFGLKDGYNRKDLLKIAHYVALAIYCLNKKEREDAEKGKSNRGS